MKIAQGIFAIVPAFGGFWFLMALFTRFNEIILPALHGNYEPWFTAIQLILSTAILVLVYCAALPWRKRTAAITGAVLACLLCGVFFILQNINPDGEIGVDMTVALFTGMFAGALVGFIICNSFYKKKGKWQTNHTTNEDFTEAQL